ncbi:MAG: hypothetical protein JSV28_08840 [Deltaproteobacteria bacterium]|nr:MAG: hypothetical protein JSV28_08840 [Deltaproteobacteria bacterium]
MSKKRYRPEEIIGKLREADVLFSQGKKVVDVIAKIHGAGGGGRTLTALRPRDFESDQKGTDSIGRSCK